MRPRRPLACRWSFWNMKSLYRPPAAPARRAGRRSIGRLVERSVPPLVVPRGQMKTNLLGMSFLDRLESWEVRADQLMLRGFPEPVTSRSDRGRGTLLNSRNGLA